MRTMTGWIETSIKIARRAATKDKPEEYLQRVYARMLKGTLRLANSAMPMEEFREYFRALSMIFGMSIMADQIGFRRDRERTEDLTWILNR